MTTMAMTYTNAVDFTRRGNTVGFTSKGEAVCGGYLRTSKSWFVQVDSGAGLCDPRSQRFGTKPEAIEHARTLLDEAKTTELAWW